MSKVEDEVCAIIQARAKKVQATDKYAGLTMERDDLTQEEWLEHLQHELMDAVIYVQRLRTREQTIEEKLREVAETTKIGHMDADAVQWVLEELLAKAKRL